MHSGTITGIRPGDLDLAATLNSGQMFRWNRDSDGAWRGMVGRRRFRLSQSEDGKTIYFEADGTNPLETARTVRSFLRLDDADLPGLAAAWSAKDPSFAEAWAARPGVRILRQDPEECFFAFLCASVAPIARIRGMLTAVAAEFGTMQGDGYTQFPSAVQLSSARETRLRELGLGFRARRLVEAALLLARRPEDALTMLRLETHENTQGYLTREFHGLGQKIADCICLFALDKDSAIPVDTHIWRIGRARYAPELAGKSLTAANYARIATAFQSHFGPMAGWAQQILFYRAALGSRNAR